jgi:hypothetical protein
VQRGGRTGYGGAQPIQYSDTSEPFSVQRGGAQPIQYSDTSDVEPFGVQRGGAQPIQYSDTSDVEPFGVQRGGSGNRETFSATINDVDNQQGGRDGSKLRDSELRGSKLRDSKLHTSVTKNKYSSMSATSNDSDMLQSDMLQSVASRAAFESSKSRNKKHNVMNGREQLHKNTTNKISGKRTINVDSDYY